MTDVVPALTARAYDNSTFLDLVGVRTHVQAWGPDDAAATVVGLHHFYGSAQTYHRLGAVLAAAGIRLLAFDRVGFGLTERPDPAGNLTGPTSPYTRAFALRQVLALCDRYGVTQPVVTGTSMGGTTALELALEHPERVGHVVPCAAPVTADASPRPAARRLLRWPALAGPASALIERVGDRIDADRVARSWHDPARVEPADVEAHTRMVTVDGWARGLWWKYVADIPPTLPDRLGELVGRVPVTAVGARHDRLVPARVAQRIASATGGTYVEVEGGHVVHAECADELAALMCQIAGVA